ncbi:hypothetical protein [Streptomyces sp. NPDC002467]|uniref:hypothetical protein n=1 Tax=Streptomyces sp. NPDC002467 TaxID=3364647 RepID=UPI00367EE9B2
MNTADLAPYVATDRTEDLAVELLIWLRAQRSGRAAESALTDFVADDDPRAAMAEAAAQLLRSRGHITLEYTFGAALVRLRAAGLTEADRVVQVRGRVGPQFDHALDELVRQAAESPDATVSLKSFLARTTFLGLPLRPGIVRRAVRYLQGHELVMPFPPAFGGEPDALMLTPRGEDCAVSNRNVRQYMNDRQQPATTPTFTQNVYGGAAAQGVTVSQNIGHPATETALVIDRIRALAAAHGIGGPQFDADVEALQDAEREPAGRAGAWHRIREVLIQAAPALAGQAALAGIDQGLGLLGVPGLGTQ